MILKIAENYDTAFNEDTYTLKTSMLLMKSTHLFIASHAWERVELDLSDEIPNGYLSSLNLVTKDIKVRLPETVTDKTLVLLTELFPSKAGTLRRSYMLGRPVSEVLTECLIVQ